ncbi:hypothetical protein [Pueribacillus sp. YX66]|uniref:hypothetical protein n=1 Tax=Pueribacillus sp. YX66 TaxID=3229242 RepID=UPI00358D495D
MGNKVRNLPLPRMSLLMTMIALLFISACSNTETSDDNGNDNGNKIKQDTEVVEKENAEVTYEADVKEMIANNCLTCHGEDSPLPMHDYESLMVYVDGEDTGALMRRLDNGENTEDGKPGNMYEYLGETDEEREENLAVIKEWVGNWTVKRNDEITDEERDEIQALKN